MKKKKLVALLLGSLTVFALAGTLAGCRDKGEDDSQNNNDPSNTQKPTETNKDINYKPGDVIVDEKEYEFTETDRATGYTVKYTETQIDVKYLAGNSSYITLTGRDRADMHVTGYRGELQEISLKDIESKVKVNNAPISVSTIDKSAFEDCATLEKVDLSKQNSALSFVIEEEAFANCVSVTDVIFPDKVYVEYNKVGDSAFYNNIALTNVKLGEKFTDFGEGVFESCVSLTSVTLPQKLTGISASMFSGCESLQTITLPAGVKTIKAAAFKSTALTAIPFSDVKDLRYIGDSAFENTQITSITVPDTVTYIGNHAFYDCAKLASVTVPFIGQDITTAALNGSHEMPSYMFISRYGMPSQTAAIGSDEEALTGRSVNVTVTKANGIPAYAFAFANDVKTVNVNFAAKGKYKVYSVNGETSTTKEVTVSKTMGNAAFYGCTALTGVTLPATENVASNAFYNCKSLASYTIPASATKIEESAFRGCTKLSAVTVPDSVKEIGSYAFRNSGLTSFSLKYGMKYGSSILADCTKLQSITIDKYDDYTVVTDDDGNSLTQYVTLGSLDNLFARDTDLNSYDYFTSSYPLYQRDDGSYNPCWIPKSLTKITVGQICEVPYGIVAGLSSLTEVSLTFKDKVSDNFQNGKSKTANIQSNAFKNCTKLATLTVTNGDKVKSIGANAFDGCTVLPDSVLSSFNKVQAIGDRAFSGCEAFRNVIVPATVLYSTINKGVYSYQNGLDSEIFYNCNGITSLTVEKYSLRYNTDNYGYNYAITSLGKISDMFGTDYDDYFDEDYDDYYNGVPVTLKSVVLKNVISLGNAALQDMKHITSAEISFAETTSSSVNYSVGANAFAGCSKLATLTITNGDKVKSIGANAFDGCTVLPDSVLTSFNKVNTIGSYAFSGCEAFRNVTVPASVLYYDSYVRNGLGSNIFYNCYGIQTLIVEQYSFSRNGNSTSIDSIKSLFGAEQGSNENYDTFQNKYNNGVPVTLKSVALEGVISLSSSALKDMKHITSAEIYFAEPETEYSTYSYSIGSSAFNGCTKLETVEVYFADTVNGANHTYAVNGSAFAGCTSLTEVLTDSTDVKVSFSTNVFTNCYNLETVELPVYIDPNNSVYGVFCNMSYTDSGYYGTTHNPTLKEITLMLPESYNSYYLGKLFDNSSSTSSNSYVYSSLKTVNLVAAPVDTTDSDDEAEKVATFRIPTNMFSGCTGLTSVVFDANEVNSIGQNAFNNCSNLTGRTNPEGTNVYVYRNWVVGNTFTNTSSTGYIVPATVVGVGENTLGSYNAPNVYFLGTAEAWEKVLHPSYSNPTVYYYSKNAPTAYGPHWQYDADATTTDVPVLWTYGAADNAYTFNANGGIFDNDETVTTKAVNPSNKGTVSDPTYELEETETPSKLTREGYFFDGWYTDSACTKKASFPYYSTTQTTFYAKWVTYQITHNSSVTEEDGEYTMRPTSTYSSNDAFIYIETTSDIVITLQFRTNGHYSDDKLFIYKDGNYDYYTYVGNSSTGGWVDYPESGTIELSAGSKLCIRYHISSTYYNSNAQIRNIVITPVEDEA